MEQIQLQEAYLDALKMGKHAWNQKIFRGESGYLRTLDSMLQKGDIVTEYPLGLVEIPIQKIVGTYTHGRSISFADNFMPIMDASTEFARKWMSLYNYHIESGIADPIKVYEYLNRFFVIEGNKRVSVLKYVNGTHINGQVIRLLPKRNPEDKTNTLYYEFVKFYRETHINEIWFSEIGRFTELLEYISLYREQAGEEKEDVGKHFLASWYHPFRKLYHDLGGGKLEITTGDAFLTFLQLYGLSEPLTAENHRQHIKQLIEELATVTSKNTNVDRVETEAIQTTKKSVFSSLTDLMTPKKKLKIAFVYAKTPTTSGWTYSHELGRLHIENKFKGQIQTDKIENVPENDQAYDTFKRLVDEKYDVIFATNPTYLAPALKAAMADNKVRFFNCGVTHSYRSLTLYYGRLHEPRYLEGMIAGAKTQTNIIGYVAPFPISDVISSINAFTLGAQAVNPYVKVKALWTNCWDSPKESRRMAEILINEGADIISNEDCPIPGDPTKEYGVYHIHHKTGDKTHYAMSIWNWGIFYEQVIQNLLYGSLRTIGENDVPLNYWQGLSNGIVDLLYSNRHINFPMKQLIETVKQAIISNEFQIFTGPIYDQKHKLRVGAGDRLSYEDIICMDWLVEGIEGNIPDIKALTPVDPFSYLQGL